MNGKTSEKLRLYACLNATLQNGFTNPIDQAIASLNVSINAYEKVNEIPYDFIRKRLSVAVKNNQRRFFVTKGAFSNVLEICNYVENENGTTEFIDEHRRKVLEDTFVAYSQDGYRVLG